MITDVGSLPGCIGHSPRQLFGSNATTMATLLNSSLARYAQEAYDAGAAVSVEAALGLAEIQRDLVLGGGV